MKAKAGMGVAVSTMRRPDDDHMTDERKTVFDWCKDGVVGQVVDRLQQEHDVDATDENVRSCARKTNHCYRNNNMCFFRILPVLLTSEMMFVCVLYARVLFDWQEMTLLHWA